jgi:glyoxylase-like metal-dependent hydrolase (beta-lactamase superfamily II)
MAAHPQTFDPTAPTVVGAPIVLSPRIVRVTAPNGGVMTGPGTNTYLVGNGPTASWTVIDPGPDDAAHLDAVLEAAGGQVEAIVVTHTHIDHSPGAATLKRLLGVPVMGMRARFPERQDASFVPDRVLMDGDRLSLGDHTHLRVIHTPGHASNHLCYLLEEERTLFTGDHVMQGSTVIVNPPDGDMAAYLKSLGDLMGRDIEWLAPGHGSMMPEPVDVLRRLIRHRSVREAKVVSALKALAPADLDRLVVQVYDDTPASRHGIAKRSLEAHLNKLRDEGQAIVEGGLWRQVAGSNT